MTKKCLIILKKSSNFEEGDGGDGGGGDGRIFPEPPSPILHAPRDNISRKDKSSLRYIPNHPIRG